VSDNSANAGPSISGLNRLHLGCGLITPPGWVNIDGSWNARLAKHPLLRRTAAALGLIPKDRAEIPWSSSILVHDVREPLPFPSNSASAIYASHLLEHLYFEEARRVVKECSRVLAPGGAFRVVVPDLESIVREYLGELPFGELPKEFQELTPADRLNRRLLMHPLNRPSGNFVHRIYSSWVDFHEHKWMYDERALVAQMESGGFAEVQRMQFRVSRIEGIAEVEQASRVLNGEGMCIEGVKPRA
jgi:predicted SAM-dependent methyltransferase